MSDYIVALKELAATCDFGEFPEQALRDRIVCGLRSEATQKKLLAEKDLTWKSAQKIALAMEMAAHEAPSFASGAGASSGSSKATAADVNKVSQNKQYFRNTGNRQSTDKSQGQGYGDRQSAGTSGRRKFDRPCYRCGWNNHSDDCRHKNATCLKCGKVGHIVR